MTINDPTRPPFTPSIVTEAVMKAMRGLNPGEVITYDQLDTVANCDVRKESRHSLSTARKSLRRDEGIVFENMKHVGFRRLPNDEISDRTWSKDSQKIRRAAIDAKKNQVAVALDDIPEDLRSEVIARTMVFHLIAKSATNRVVKQLAPCATNNWKEIPPLPSMVRRAIEDRREKDRSEPEDDDSGAVAL